MQHVKIVILYSIISLCLALSGGSDYFRLFSRAEALMNKAPEEALALLKSVSLSELKRKEDRARYALLMSQALDKNYIDVSSDSLIRLALDYYGNTKDHKNRMLTFYYEGLVQINSQNYSTSAVSFENAIKEAALIEDYFYLGLSNRALSQIMNETNNYVQALAYSEKAIECFKRCAKKDYEQYEWLDLATDYYNDKQYTKAISVCDSLISSVESHALKDYFELVKADSFVELGNIDYKVPLSIYRDVDEALFTIADYGHYAYALNKIGLRDSSDYYLQKALSISKNYIDSTVATVFQARIESERKHYMIAYQLLDHAVVIQDSLTRALLSQSVSVAQKEFFETESQYQRIRARSARVTTTLTIFFSISLLMIGLLLLNIRKRKIDDFQKDQLAQLALEKQRTRNLALDNAHLLGSLFSERLGRIDRLAQDYLCAETQDEKDRIFKEYKRKCTSIMNDAQVYDSLEADLNKYCNGIMQKLRTEVPALKENHLRSIMLFFAGIPTISVQILTGKPSRKAVEMERSRFRKVIKDSQAEHAHQFLEMLETKVRNANPPAATTTSASASN